MSKRNRFTFFFLFAFVIITTLLVSVSLGKYAKEEENTGIVLTVKEPTYTLKKGDSLYNSFKSATTVTFGNIRDYRNVINAADVASTKKHIGATEKDLVYLYNSGTDYYVLSYGNIRMNPSAIYMFYGCSNLKTISNFESVDMSEVTDISNMFNGCSSLTSITFGDTEKLSGMSAVFQNCKALKTVDLSRVNAQNVTSTYCMFF